eukprot:1842734-Rhodomonas_salina.1
MGVKIPADYSGEECRKFLDDLCAVKEKVCFQSRGCVVTWVGVWSRVFGHVCVVTCIWSQWEGPWLMRRLGLLMLLRRLGLLVYWLKPMRRLAPMCRLADAPVVGSRSWERSCARRLAPPPASST